MLLNHLTTYHPKATVTLSFEPPYHIPTMQLRHFVFWCTLKQPSQRNYVIFSFVAPTNPTNYVILSFVAPHNAITLSCLLMYLALQLRHLLSIRQQPSVIKSYCLYCFRSRVLYFSSLFLMSPLLSISDLTRKSDHYLNYIYSPSMWILQLIVSFIYLTQRTLLEHQCSIWEWES